MDIGKMMEQNAGTCIFPVGDCKSLCGALTLLGAQGEKLPFCAKHQKEIEEIFRHKQQQKNKKRHSLPLNTVMVLK